MANDILNVNLLPIRKYNGDIYTNFFSNFSNTIYSLFSFFGEAYNHHNYKLMETPERGLIHKICNGATAETFAGFEEMRTVAFTAAETGVVDGHGFYEESYKLMHVVAQCDGHVEACECGECVSAAAAAAAEECPWSIAGQIYLEGCYVGYTYNPHEYPGDSYHGTYACI